jgi:hypothetical protein
LYHQLNNRRNQDKSRGVRELADMDVPNASTTQRLHEGGLVQNVQSSRRSVLDFLSPSESPPAPARAPQLAPSTRISRIVALMVVLGWFVLDSNSTRIDAKKSRGKSGQQKMEATRMRLGLRVRRSQTEKFGVYWRRNALNTRVG